jgi:hypothetical protein
MKVTTQTEKKEKRKKEKGFATVILTAESFLWYRRSMHINFCYKKNRGGGGNLNFGKRKNCEKCKKIDIIFPGTVKTQKIAKNCEKL